jgi:hypothetical protein
MVGSDVGVPVLVGKAVAVGVWVGLRVGAALQADNANVRNMST